MAITTNFDEWLDLVCPRGDKEIYSLYETVSNETSNGVWMLSRENGYFLVRIGHVGEILMIGSLEAKQLFLSKICEKFYAGETLAICRSKIGQ